MPSSSTGSQFEEGLAAIKVWKECEIFHGFAESGLHVPVQRCKGEYLFAGEYLKVILEHVPLLANF